MDALGNLYATTGGGGAFGGGTVFRLDSARNETVLHNFAGSPDDGAGPSGALILDTAGNLYGATVAGGASNNCPQGCGTLFKLDTSGKETVLHGFTGSPNDGAFPAAGLIMDMAGNLYGTTQAGGVNCFQGCGTVFKVDTSGNETLVHSFTGSPSDGALPLAGLVMDRAGNLYGTTNGGGTCNPLSSSCGTIFRVDTSGNETLIHSFTGSPSDGALPLAGLE